MENTMYLPFADKALYRLVAVMLLLFSDADLVFAAELTLEEASQLALKR